MWWERFTRTSRKREVTRCAAFLAAVSLGLVSAPAAAPVFTTVFSFPSGSSPYGDLTVGSRGVIYGVAGGGTYGQGLVYSLTPPSSPGTWTQSVLWNFGAYGDGTQPAGVIIGQDGVLYGSACNGGAYGNGMVFTLSPPTTAGGPWTENVLWNFGNGDDGIQPCTGVVAGSGGVLYGATIQGGSTRLGIVFSLTPPAISGGAWTEAILHTFTGGSDAAFQDYGDLTIGPDGVLYGVAGGGDFAVGCVFAVTPPASPGGAWTERVIYSFQAGLDGAYPQGGLFLGDGGILYGTTATGGPGGGGTVYSLTPPTSRGGAWSEAVIHHFLPAEGLFPGGQGPQGSLWMSKSTGAVFGTARLGGSAVSPTNYGYGTVFELKPPALPGDLWKMYTLEAFDLTDGSGPNGLARGTRGPLFGITNAGGAQSAGTVFSLSQ